MKVSELIAQLQEVPPDMDASAWMKTALVWTTPALTFEEAGKAMRVMLNLVGKPTMNYNKDASGKSLHHRSVIWKMPLEKHILCAQALADVGITSVKSDGAWYFSFRIPYSAYVTAFYTSDDPEVWKAKQLEAETRAEQKAAKKEANKLAKQAKHQAEWEEHNKEYREKWEAEKAKKEAEEAEKARLVALGLQAQKDQEKIEKIRVDDVVVSRDITVEEIECQKQS